MSRAMKDSGIPWIGKIPKDWNVNLIGSCIKEVDCKNTNCNEDNALQFKMGAIISKRNGDSKYNPETLEAYNIVKVGDIIINGLNLSFDLISQRVGLVKENGVITSTYIAVRPTTNISNEFLTYLFKAYDNCKAFHSMGRGLRQTLSYGELRKYYVVLPFKEEQQRIAEFLDRKCSEIDEAIALQEEFIEELKSYKQSVITEAVTRGLNPNVKFKDSGIDWIGKIPQGWEIRAIKTLARLKSGTNITTNDIAEDGKEYPVYGGNGLRGYYSEYSNDGDFALIGRQGALCGNINYGFGKFWATDHCVVCYPREEYVLKWFGETLRAMNLNQYSLSSAQPGLSVERIKDKFMPVPPLTEQHQIADYLGKKCGEIDGLIAIKQQKIEELKDYKKSIIYEYVTGKKEEE